jgi:hypothetical protein
MHWLQPIRAWCLLAVTIFSVASPSYAQVATEAQVKAAYVYNFAKFVEWPERSFNGPTAPLRLCAWNDPFFESELHQVTANKAVSGHPITTATVIDAEHARGCHVLFIPSSQDKQTRSLMEISNSGSILTVGESVRFLEHGGMIRFVLRDQRVQFAVNNKAANAAGLHISARLLGVATVVTER